MVNGIRARLWLAWLVVGSAAVAGYFALPAGTPSRDLFYVAIGVLSAAVVWLGGRSSRPDDRPMWYWFATGIGMWALGDLIWAFYIHVLEREPYPSAADVCYLIAYPMVVLGLLRTARRRSRDLAGLLDAAIIATGLGLVLWSFIMRPIAYDESSDLLARAIGLAYPAADLLLLGIVVRMFTVPGARTASLRLLVFAVVLLLGGDIGFALLTTFSSYDGGLIDIFWLLSYVVWAAAALHPSARSVTHDSPARPVRFTRWRLVVLALSSLLAPALLILQGALDAQTVDWLGIGTGAIVLFLLVVARLSGLTLQVQRQTDELSALSLRDDLTGLPNRRLLEQRLRAALPGRVHVGLVDLDDFKSVNDRLGHAVGDRLVVALGERLSPALRSTDTIARLGGDEFAIVMPGAGAAEADAVMRRVTDALQRPVAIGRHELLVQASIGVADADGTDDPFEVLRRADVAMYAAKDAGGNQHVRFRPEMDERALEHAQVGAQLRSALDEGHFRLLYQPIVELPDGRITGAEALIRWHHPRLGSIAPPRFVPIAERNGLIVPIGAWVLREACTQAASWRRDLGGQAPARISVNVSARQLAEPGFADMVAGVLAETGLPPAALAVEVTETAVFNGGRALEAVHAVHRLGVNIALDDFGTGHSSLGLLQTCPVDILKVDKSFVEGITIADHHTVIATALISLSDGLNLKAVAEGVETAAQAEALHRLGYRFAQGYHFGRPVSAEDLAARLLAEAPTRAAA